MQSVKTSILQFAPRKTENGMECERDQSLLLSMVQPTMVKGGTTFLGASCKISVLVSSLSSCAHLPLCHCDFNQILH